MLQLEYSTFLTLILNNMLKFSGTRKQKLKSYKLQQNKAQAKNKNKIYK